MGDVLDPAIVRLGGYLLMACMIARMDGSNLFRLASARSCVYSPIQFRLEPSEGGICGTLMTTLGGLDKLAQPVTEHSEKKGLLLIVKKIKSVNIDMCRSVAEITVNIEKEEHCHQQRRRSTTITAVDGQQRRRSNSMDMMLEQTLVSTVATSVSNSTSVFSDLLYADWAGNGSGLGNGSDRADREPEKSVHDIEYDMPLRKAILYIQIVVGILGAILLFIYMMHSRR
ncbi:hypothetical protein EGW08_008227 [Elysia chlorotica]|uniref:Uncharacterized protein n=1 Tax=Elysia chlorotica TaxID=188477 RepID=A0A3S1C639_ELYCH|nr:hypothetical protein EGW08_008227 [Elysia chlorotica]